MEKSYEDSIPISIQQINISVSEFMAHYE